MTDQARVLEKAVAAWESLTGTQLTGIRQTMLTIPRRTSVESWPSSARGAGGVGPSGRLQAGRAACFPPKLVSR